MLCLTEPIKAIQAVTGLTWRRYKLLKSLEYAVCALWLRKIEHLYISFSKAIWVRCFFFRDGYWDDDMIHMKMNGWIKMKVVNAEYDIGDNNTIFIKKNSFLSLLK